MTIRSRAWATGDGGDVTLGRAHACAETTAPSQRGSSLWGTGLSRVPGGRARLPRRRPLGLAHRHGACESQTGGPGAGGPDSVSAETGRQDQLGETLTHTAARALHGHACSSSRTRTRMHTHTHVLRHARTRNTHTAAPSLAQAAAWAVSLMRHAGC